MLKVLNKGRSILIRPVQSTAFLIFTEFISLFVYFCISFSYQRRGPTFLQIVPLNNTVTGALAHWDVTKLKRKDYFY